MGYGIVIWCHDPTVRALRAENGDDRAAMVVGRHLADLLGRDPYPSGGLPARRDGPLAVVGAWHADRQVVLRMGPYGATTSPTGAPTADPPAGGEPEDEECWVAQLNFTDLAAVANAALRSPRPLETALAVGQRLPESVFGPNRVAGSSLASLWWFYADALLEGPPDPVLIGAAVVGLLDTRLTVEAAVDRHANALNKAGALVAHGDVLVVWSGNRLHHARDRILTPRGDRE